MKIAMVTSFFGKGGGIDTHIKEISKFFPDEVSILSDQVVWDNVRDVKNEIIEFKNYPDLLKKLKDFDIVHVHYFPTNLVVALNKKLRKIKLVHTWHGIVPARFFDSFKRKAKTALVRLSHLIALKESDRIISVSKFLQEQVKNSVYIPNGVDTTFFKKMRKKDERKRVIYVGALERYRGVHMIPKFARELKDVEFVVVGRGKFEPLLRNISNIKLLGYVPNYKMPELYSQCDVSIRPSLYEGFGIPVLEALSCSLPVITSNFPCFYEIIDDGANGFITELDNFVEKIKFLFDNNKIRKKMGRSARRKAKKFEWKRIAKKVHEMYEELH